MSRQRVYGVTKCFDCHQLLTPDADVVEVPGVMQQWGQDSAGFRRGPLVEIANRWHRACLEAFVRLGDISRAKGAIEQCEGMLEVAAMIEDEGKRAAWVARIEADLVKHRAALAALS